MPRLRSALAAPAALLALTTALLAPAGASVAAPTEGSVPSEVSAYVADGSLVHQLSDVYGPGAGGEGIEFDETTKAGTIERVHVWSDALRAGEDTDRYVELLNEWVVPISIAEKPVGLATIWINPASVLPELASFVRDADLAVALSAVPAGSSLVHDAPSAAWLALAEDGTLTPLVPGSTGLSTPVPIDDVAILPAAGEETPPGGDPNTGVGLAIAVLLVLLAIIVVALVVPTVRRRSRGGAEPDADEAPSEESVEPTAAVEKPTVEEPAVEKSTAEKPATKRQAAKKAAAPKPPTEPAAGD